MNPNQVLLVVGIAQIELIFQDFVDNLTSDQFKLISSFFQNTPVLEYDLRFNCEKCEHESSYELRGLQSFFT